MGVVHHPSDKQLNLIDPGCICHLENLAMHVYYYDELSDPVEE